jgi:hypothetical protein
MALDILDGNGLARTLKTTLDGSDYVPHQRVDVCALPTGASTSANQTTLIGHVDGIETLLGTIDTDTGAIATSTASIDGKITACNTGAVVISSGTITTVTTVGAVTAITNALPAGTNNIGDVDVLTVPALVASTATIGDVGLVGRTTGGLTLHRRLSTGTDSTNVKASAGQLFWAFITNANASARFIKFYNSASAPTLGSGTPVLTFLIPPGSSGLQLTAEQGLAFGTGIGYTLSTGVADANAVAVAADEIVVNLGYR